MNEKPKQLSPAFVMESILNKLDSNENRRAEGFFQKWIDLQQAQARGCLRIDFQNGKIISWNNNETHR